MNTENQSSSHQLKPKRHSNKVTEHLANERTYLAWLRTAIALMGFGVVIARLRLIVESNVDNPISHWKLGLMFSLIGLITVLVSAKHYFSVRQDIDASAYHPPATWMVVFSLSIFILGSVVIFYLLTVQGELTKP